ncbi:MAG TPA: trypsin-like peptidase domain-containing protein [Thermoanaerobaculia bacterium]|nr:trypsin-like peptidase domain-containing protein [Thermoanaerobaculia bacterium]
MEFDIENFEQWLKAETESLDERDLFSALGTLEALSVAAEDSPEEQARIRGLIGGLHQELYLRSEPGSRQARDALEQAVSTFYDLYDSSPERRLRHGAAALALLARGRRDGIVLAGFPEPEILAAEILRAAAVRAGERRWHEPADFAAAAGACVALGRTAEAVDWMRRYVRNEGDVCELRTVLHQLTTVWQIDESGGIERFLLSTLRARLAEAEMPAPEAAPAHLPPEKPLALHENVAFTVYKPKTVAPLAWYPLLAFAHLEELPEEERRPGEPSIHAQIEGEAEAELGARLRDYTDHSEDSSQAIPPEAEITFVPFIPGFRFNPPQATFLFVEAVHKQKFLLQAPPDLDGQVARGRLSIYWGRILLAELNLKVRVDNRFRAASSRDAEPEREAIRPYRDIFASYSHEDTSIVLEFERYARALGDRYLIDRDHLRAGEIWDERLRSMIRQADAFQLFWSQNALRSVFVEREWRYALSLGRESFVRPVYWEEPLPELPERNLPPQELRRLHFHRLRKGAGTAPMPQEPAGRETYLQEIDRSRQEERDSQAGERAKSRKSMGLLMTVGLLAILLPAAGGIGSAWWAQRKAEAERAALEAKLAEQRAALEKETNLWARVEKQVSPMVARIECRYRLHPSLEDLGGYVEGSGVQIRPGLILTALHVVEPWRFVIPSWNEIAETSALKPEYDFLEVQFPGQQPLQASVIAVSTEQGLALLRVEVAKMAPVPLARANSDVRVTDSIAILGYPGSPKEYQIPARNVSGFGGEFREVNPTFLRGTVAQPLSGTSRSLVFDAAVEPGTGGGPVVNRRGEIIGIVTLRFDEPGLPIEILGQKVATRLPSPAGHQAVSPDGIRTFLRRHGAL